ncbi:MAG: dCTP deaminase [Candidatus Hodarchaeales archaeon]
MLSKNDIIREIQNGHITIDPFDIKSVGPCSVDLHLADKFTVFKTGKALIPGEDHSDITELVDTKGKAFMLSPGQFILASTVEKISVSKSFAGYLDGKSSNARMGIIVHAAGLVNPGTGLKKPTTLTLEIYCMVNSTIQLIPGMGIIQISYHQLRTPVGIGYDEREESRYVGLTEPRL